MYSMYYTNPTILSGGFHPKYSANKEGHVFNHFYQLEYYCIHVRNNSHAGYFFFCVACEWIIEYYKSKMQERTTLIFFRTERTDNFSLLVQYKLQIHIGIWFRFLSELSINNFWPTTKFIFKNEWMQLIDTIAIVHLREWGRNFKSLTAFIRTTCHKCLKACYNQ